jgi:hypothetical protein
MRCASPRPSQLVALTALAVTLLFTSQAAAAPYTFTQQDYIEYGIYFSPGGRQNAHKLLTIRFGDIKGWYAKYQPGFKDIPTQQQTLRLRTRRGSVVVNRKDNVGLTVTRDTYNEKKRTGTKRLDVNFQNATCTDAAGLSSPCTVDLVLITDGPDIGASRERRTLTITTSTGLSFTYRTRRRVAGTPYTPADFRAPVVSNYAWEWRPGFER